MFGFLHRTLGLYVEERQLGEVLTQKFLVRITDYTGREPDLLFVSRKRLEIIEPNYLAGAPDLVIEIVSPHDRPNEIVQKQAEYEQLGVKELWIIDQPRTRLAVFDLSDEDHYVPREPEGDTLVARTVPGFQLRVEWLWREPRQFPSGLAVVQDLLKP